MRTLLVDHAAALRQAQESLYEQNPHACWARCDNQGLRLGFILTGGEASDYTAADPLMTPPLPKPKALLANKRYNGDRFRESLLIRGILPIIPPRSNRKVPKHPDYRRYRHRNRVERMFRKLKQQRRIAIRYDKTVLSFESFLNLGAARMYRRTIPETLCAAQHVAATLLLRWRKTMANSYGAACTVNPTN